MILENKKFEEDHFEHIFIQLGVSSSLAREQCRLRLLHNSRFYLELT